MKPSIYIETSIFSFYFDQRQSPAIVARREWTRKWWEEHRAMYDLLTSSAALTELDRGKKLHKQDSLKMALELRSVSVTQAVEEIVAVYIKHHVMPDEPLGDAMHLALASFHKCSFLLTWNCEHIANANKFGHIRRINALLDLHTPELVTPLQLLGKDYAL